MFGDKLALKEKEENTTLDESYRDDVKFGDNSKVSILGKGQVIIQTKDNATQIISNVFSVLELKSNLIGVGQLQEKSYEIFIKGDVC